MKYLLFTCKKAEYIRGIHLSVMCVKNIFFLFDFGLLFNLKIVFFSQRDLLHLYDSNLVIPFKVVFSCTFFEILTHGYPHSAVGGPPTSRHHYFFSSLCRLNCMQKGLFSNTYLIQSLRVPLQNPNLSSLSVVYFFFNGRGMQNGAGFAFSW